MVAVHMEKVNKRDMEMEKERAAARRSQAAMRSFDRAPYACNLILLIFLKN